MAVWAIGDVQGCYDDLCHLLQHINFNPDEDTLWFAGDIVNRGDKSLETLRFVKDLGDKAITVLGNHDLTLLALAHGHGKSKNHTLDPILNAPDRDELLDWLRHQPLLHHDETLGYTMIHAGLPPQWDLETAKQCALEVEAVLQGDNYVEFLAEMFGNKPKIWESSLKGMDRYRFITNCFSRMRFCTAEGELEFKSKGAVGTQRKGYYPWYSVQGRKSQNLRIIFGHWSTLLGRTGVDNAFALDTGCLWGGKLTAMHVQEDPDFIGVNCTHCLDPFEHLKDKDP